MNVISVIRSKSRSDDKGTYGTIYFNRQLLGKTVEQPWNNNVQGHSCVPEGLYELHKHSSPKHPDTVSLHNPNLNIYAEPTDVPSGTQGRTDCLIHPANYPNELEGCIAPGMRYLGTDLKPIGVGSSVECYNMLGRLWGDRSNLVLAVSWGE